MKLLRKGNFYKNNYKGSNKINKYKNRKEYMS